MKPKFNVAIFHVGELFVVNILGYFAYHVFYYQQHQIMFPHTLFIQIQVDFQNDFKIEFLQPYSFHLQYSLIFDS